ncbi:MAG TPA: cytochrome D1 domain-containing protein [Candidatus Limnocylindria bacterium]
MHTRRVTTLLITGIMLAACSATGQSATPGASSGAVPSDAPNATPLPTPTVEPTPTATPPGGVYSGTVGGQLDPRVADLPLRVYVPNELSNDVAVIDPQTLTVIGRFDVGAAPEHITPDWDLSKLYVNNMNGASLTVIDPLTEKPSGTQQVPFPYNLYYTPDGSKAIVVADYLGMGMIADNGLYFYDRETWKLLKFVQVPWPGVNHLDFSPDGSFLVVSCESAGVVAKINTQTMTVEGSVKLGGSPLDVRLAPAGDVFFVANQGTNGVDVVDALSMERVDFIPTAKGAHGFALSRDVTRLFVMNRLAGSISVIDVATRKVVDTWEVGGSPDMAALSPDGTQLWVSNRFHGTVMVLNPETGEVIKVIPTGGNPHGLTFWPQPGTISLGHNGNMR